MIVYKLINKLTEPFSYTGSVILAVILSLLLVSPLRHLSVNIFFVSAIITLFLLVYIKIHKRWWKIWNPEKLVNKECPACGEPALYEMNEGVICRTCNAKGEVLNDDN